jgi:hypothetical protein
MTQTGNFQSLPTRFLDNGPLRLEILAEAGPRIVRLFAFGGQNLLAELPLEEKLTSSYGDFYFRGGHRLWHSPEAIPRTYIPDNAGVTVDELADGLRLNGPSEPGSGIAKTIEIRMAEKRAAATLIHTLRNDGLWAVEFAPWVLTMLRQGGTAIFPQPVGNADPHGLLSNRILSIWPYTRINDPRLALRDDFILIRATPSLPPVKIGYYNPHGWMAYWIDGQLFRKSFDLHPGGAYPDNGCNTETYCNHMFIELESLGPLTKLAPGQSVTLTETWEVFDALEQDFLPGAIREKILA